MIPTIVLIASSLICLLIGAGLGLLISRTLLKGDTPKDLQSQYNSLQDEYTQYQHNVAQHFVDTSRLIIETQQQQQQLREHLVSGALNLTSADVSRSILAAGDEAEIEAPAAPALENIDPSNITPPKDWAPKAPGEQGVLSESFGLKEEEEDTSSIEVKTAKAALQPDNDK